MLMHLSRLADRFAAVVMEGSRDPVASREEDELRPVGVAVTAVVLAISVVAFTTAMALALDHLMDAAVTFAIGQSA